jgi:hypothetical protein
LLLKNADPRLAAYVVWVPQLGARENDVPGATRLIADPRVTHYWDPNGAVGDAYGKLLLSGPRPAWDVYFLFGAGAFWPKTGVPRPTYWMQQLSGVSAAPHLDGDQFAREASKLLSQIPR